MEAFVYMEKQAGKKSVYTIHYSGNHTARCQKMQSQDEKFFIQTLKDIDRRNKITLLSMLPLDVNVIEGTITRIPYDLSFLKKTSASY
jgi:hypothetical protein